MKPLQNVTPEGFEGKGKTLFCGRMHFVGTTLTASVLCSAASSLVETIMLFTEYFSTEFGEWEMEKLELFLSESDMHEEKKPWQTTFFNQ